MSKDYLAKAMINDGIVLEEPAKASESALSDLLCGDINQGIGDNLEILRVDGHPDGLGLPNSFLIRDKKTGRVGEYSFTDT